MPIIFNETINHCDVKIGEGFIPVSAGFASDMEGRLLYEVLEDASYLRREEFDIIGVLKSSFPRRCQPHRKNEKLIK